MRTDGVQYCHLMDIVREWSEVCEHVGKKVVCHIKCERKADIFHFTFDVVQKLWLSQVSK